MPPGSGAIRATAVTMRTIAQAPKPKRPSRAVSTVPAAACQTSRKPASTRTPALKAKSMSPTADGPCAGPARPGRRARCGSRCRCRRRGPGRWTARTQAGAAGPRRGLGRRAPAPAAARPGPAMRSHPVPRAFAFLSPLPSAASGRRRCARTPREGGQARVRTGSGAGAWPQLAPAAGLARPGKRRISSTPSASVAASMAPRRSSVR